MKKKLFGIFFFFLILAAAELIFGLLHLERYDHLFVQRSSYPFFVPGSGIEAGNYVTSPHFSYQLNVQSFPINKKKGTKRVFVLGGSAAYGFPYSDFYGFSGYLQRALDSVAPRRFEIINAAGMSFGSHRVLDELQDILLYDPDLIIILSGNNEFIEKNILPPEYGRNTPLTSLSGLLSKLNSYKALRLGLFRVSPKSFQRPVARDMTDFRSNTVIRRAGMVRSSETEKEVLANFRDNFKAMKELLVSQEIKAIFCTVPNNIATWTPFSTTPKFNHSADAQKWEDLQNRVSELLDAGKTGKMEVFLELERLLNELIRIDPDNATNYYNLGQVEMALEKHDAAYRFLLRARDLDGRPVRALSSFNDSIRNLVSGERGQLLLDLEETFGTVVRSGFTEGIYLDYCHFTQQGHKFVALHMLPAIQEMLNLKLPLTQLENFIDNDQSSPSGNSRIMSAESYTRGMTFNNNQMYEEAIRAFTVALDFTPPEERVFRAGVMTNIGGSYILLGQKEEGNRYYRSALETDPKSLAALLEVGKYHLEEGRLNESAEMFVRHLDINAYSPDAMIGLGRVALRQGKNREAIDWFEKAITLGDGSNDIYKGLARGFLALGNREQGLSALQKAREYDPLDPETDSIMITFGAAGSGGRPDAVSPR